MGWVSLPGVACAALLLTLTARGVAAQTCVGDCTGDGNVSIDDLIRGVNIALGKQPLSSCTAFDSHNDGNVSVAELVQAVGAALDGCPQGIDPNADHLTRRRRARSRARA
jgi:nucleoside-diphosphate-sugar epimerase